MPEFNFEKYLVDRNGVINQRLSELLVKQDEFPKSLHNAMHYSLFAGGKRLRPVLTLAACEAVAGPIEAVLNTACAIECIHTYSLIHDDLPALDNDDLRRGRPTCHKAFGEATAILAGDALLTSAFELMARTEGVEAGVVLAAISEVARAAGSTGMIGGQAVDIESEGKDIPFPLLEFIHIHKTGDLILASIKAGAILGGASLVQLESLVKYGRAVGLAFQIADDILDVEGTSAELGKAVGGDEKKGKATYPAFVGVPESKKRANELVDMAVAELDGFDGKAEPLRAVARYITARRK